MVSLRDNGDLSASRFQPDGVATAFVIPVEVGVPGFTPGETVLARLHAWGDEAETRETPNPIWGGHSECFQFAA
jgi:hypothetical protein